jgi:hypothetical protein
VAQLIDWVHGRGGRFVEPDIDTVAAAAAGGGGTKYYVMNHEKTKKGQASLAGRAQAKLESATAATTRGLVFGCPNFGVVVLVGVAGVQCHSKERPTLGKN